MTKKTIYLGAIALLAIGFVLGIYANNARVNFGSTSYDISHFVGDVYQGLNDVKMFANGVFVGPANMSSLTINSGTAITAYKCATATWNPPSVGTSTVNVAATSTDIALTGAVMGDTCTGSLTSATTSAASVNCFITGTATATIRLLNIGASALDLATGTAKVCYTH